MSRSRAGKRGSSSPSVLLPASFSSPTGVCGTAQPVIIRVHIKPSHFCSLFAHTTKSTKSCSRHVQNVTQDAPARAVAVSCYNPGGIDAARYNSISMPFPLTGCCWIGSIGPCVLSPHHAPQSTQSCVRCAVHPRDITQPVLTLTSVSRCVNH